MYWIAWRVAWVDAMLRDALIGSGVMFIQFTPCILNFVWNCPFSSYFMSSILLVLSTFLT